MNTDQNTNAFFDYLEQFATVSDKDKIEMLAISEISSFKKKELIAQKGKTINNVGFILKGAVRLFFVSDDGEEQSVEFLFENEPIGAFAGFNNKQPVSGSAQAIEETLILHTSLGKVLTFLSTRPQYYIAFTNIITQSFLKYRERDKFLRLVSARERYERLCELQPQTVERIPLTHIASYLGMKLGTLSRVRARKL